MDRIEMIRASVLKHKKEQASTKEAFEEDSLEEIREDFGVMYATERDIKEEISGSLFKKEPSLEDFAFEEAFEGFGQGD